MTAILISFRSSPTRCGRRRPAREDGWSRRSTSPGCTTRWHAGTGTGGSVRDARPGRGRRAPTTTASDLARRGRFPRRTPAPDPADPQGQIRASSAAQGKAGRTGEWFAGPYVARDGRHLPQVRCRAQRPVYAPRHAPRTGGVGEGIHPKALGLTRPSRPARSRAARRCSPPGARPCCRAPQDSQGETQVRPVQHPPVAVPVEVDVVAAAGPGGRAGRKCRWSSTGWLPWYRAH